MRKEDNIKKIADSIEQLHTFLRNQHNTLPNAHALVKTYSSLLDAFTKQNPETRTLPGFHNLITASKPSKPKQEPKKKEDDATKPQADTPAEKREPIPVKPKEEGHTPKVTKDDQGGLYITTED